MARSIWFFERVLLPFESFDCMQDYPRQSKPKLLGNSYYEVEHPLVRITEKRKDRGQPRSLSVKWKVVCRS